MRTQDYKHAAARLQEYLVAFEEQRRMNAVVIQRQRARSINQRAEFAKREWYRHMENCSQRGHSISGYSARKIAQAQRIFQNCSAVFMDHLRKTLPG